MRTKLIILMAALLSLLGLALSGMVYSQMRMAIIQGLDNELSSTAQGYVTFVQDWYNSKLQVIKAGNVLLEAPDPMTPLGHLNEAGGFALTYIGTADHRMIRSDRKPQPAGYDPVARPWYQETAASGKAGVSEPYVDFDTKKLVVTFVSPVGAGGTLKAVVGGDIFIDDLVKTVLSIKLRGNGFAFLVDKSGKVIAHPQQELTLKPLQAAMPELTAEAIAKASAGSDMSEASMNGKALYVRLVPIQGTNWVLGLAVEKNLVLAPLTKLLFSVIGIGVLLLVILLPLAGMALAGMLSGLRRLNLAMKEIAQGEGDLTRRIEVAGKDEIAETAHAFNNFIAQLQQMFAAVKGEAENVVDGVQQVSSTVQTVADDSRQISDVSSGNAATLEQITVSISHIADAAREADDLVRHAGTVSEGSVQDIERISSEMTHTVGAVKGLSSMLSTLDKRSQQISGITNVIRDIADQTNLLALNAAIEAARAGEAGRGFAVVADEVRKLAERTAQATLEITSMVDSIRGETSQAVDTMQLTLDSVDGGVELTQSAVQRISEIRGVMQDVMAKMSQISLSTSEQHNATTAIAQSTERINGRIVDSDNSLQQVHGTLSSLTQTANKMRETFARFHL
ncbi:methyl-accepting chemotaxis protein [Paludibacterium yongneupense]|uniref:methyl-accepting chemotaxis protein n=1 Tax=Paludibacterium yongneupense TaxID=400061 RepID=UPI0006853A32|nr:methyl-accepting chemotaxis protein [Paludibacterium yongneupense]